MFSVRSVARLAAARSVVSTARRALSTAVAVPGEKITMGDDGQLVVPNEPIIPHIVGDGTGPDIWASAQRVIDAAVEKAYNGEKKIDWMEVYAGEDAFNRGLGWLPEETVEAFRDYLVGVKGPLTTPVGGGIRSLNVALRQELDLYCCVRPVFHLPGVPAPVKKPELVDMVIFRENTEDIYAGIEFEAGSAEADELFALLQKLGKDSKVRFPGSSAYGVKPVSQEGSQRLVKAAVDYALKEGRKSVTLVAKGNIMKSTEGGFRKWGYEIATSPEYRSKTVTIRESWILGNKDDDPNASSEDIAKMIEPGYPLMTSDQKQAIVDEVDQVLADLYESHGNGKFNDMLLIKDAIADIALQQVLTRPEDFDVIATLNLNGDYLSDALAAQVGGIGIASGANVNPISGHALYEATHGTAPTHANLDKVNPSSVILSCAMMLTHLGWNEATDLVVKGIKEAVANKEVTYDFARLYNPPTEPLKCSEFGTAVINHM